MITSFFSQEELQTLGLKAVGTNCLVSRKASLYLKDRISLGNNVRIDDFCILSGALNIGSNVHIAAYTALYGGEAGIEMEDDTGISARCTVYSEIDDFSTIQLIGPVHPEKDRNLIKGKVKLRRYAQIGAHCVVFPGVELKEGAVLGACSLAVSDMEPWGIYYGVPAVFHRNREPRQSTE